MLLIWVILDPAKLLFMTGTGCLLTMAASERASQQSTRRHIYLEALMRSGLGFSSGTSRGIFRGQAALFLEAGGRPTPKLLV